MLRSVNSDIPFSRTGNRYDIVLRAKTGEWAFREDGPAGYELVSRDVPSVQTRHMRERYFIDTKNAGDFELNGEFPGDPGHASLPHIRLSILRKRTIWINFLFASTGSVRTSRDPADLPSLLTSANSFLTCTNTQIRSTFETRDRRPKGYPLPLDGIRDGEVYAEFARDQNDRPYETDRSDWRVVKAAVERANRRRSSRPGSRQSAHTNVVFVSEYEQSRPDGSRRVGGDTDGASVASDNLIIIEDDIHVDGGAMKVLLHELIHWAGHEVHLNNPENVMHSSGSGWNFSPHQARLLNSVAND